MTTRILFVLLLSGLTAACAGPTVNNNPALANCKSQFPWFCKGESNAPTIIVNTRSKSLSASPYCTKAIPGSELVFRITPRNSKAIGQVEILPKDTAHTWLQGKNDPDQNFIYITVPPVLGEDEKYFYGIKTDTDCVDPRVHVEK